METKTEIETENLHLPAAACAMLPLRPAVSKARIAKIRYSIKLGVNFCENKYRIFRMKIIFVQSGALMFLLST